MPTGCTFTYTPDDCPSVMASRDVKVDYNVHQSKTIFFQTATGGTPEQLSKGSTYDPTKALSANYQPTSYVNLRGDATPWDLRLKYMHGTTSMKVLTFKIQIVSCVCPTWTL